MKSLVTVLLPILMVVMFTACESDSSNEDDLPPEVEIISPADGSTNSGALLVQVTATDDGGIAYVALYIDGDSVDVSTSAPHTFAGDISDHPDGDIVLTAKAVDTSGNSTFSAPVTIVFNFDFAPEGNGVIRCSILSYTGDGTLDDTSWGDPYFIFQLTHGSQTSTVTSGVFQDSRYLTDPFSYDFDIEDGFREVVLSVEVWDQDVFDDDAVDYCPTAEGYWYSFTRETRSLEWEETYAGWDDNVPNELDCEITVRMEAVVE